MALPSSGQLGGTPTNAQFQGYIEDLRDVVSSLLGGAVRTELTIASGAVTPAVRDHGGVFSIDTEGNAASDTLDTVTQTNTHAGQIIILQAENASRVVTLNHAAGGAGQLLLADGVDFVFASTTAAIAFQQRSTDWVEIWRSVPTEDLSALTSLDAADQVRVWDDDANTEKRITVANARATLGGLVLLQSQTASIAVATMDFTTGIDATYDAYMLVIKAFVPSTDDTQLLLRVATSGPTWQAGAGAYAWAGTFVGPGGTASGDGSSVGSPTTAIPISLLSTSTNRVGNVSGEGIDAVVRITSPASTLNRKRVSWQAAYTSANAQEISVNGAGAYGATSAIVGLRLLFSSGNIAATSSASLYGVRQ